MSFTQRAIRDGTLTLGDRRHSASRRNWGCQCSTSIIGIDERVSLLPNQARGRASTGSRQRELDCASRDPVSCVRGPIADDVQIRGRRVPSQWRPRCALSFPAGTGGCNPSATTKWQPASWTSLRLGRPTRSSSSRTGTGSASQDLARSWADARGGRLLDASGRSQFLVPSRMAQRSQAPTLPPALPPGPTICPRPTDVVNESGGRLLALAQRAPTRGLPGEVRVYGGDLRLRRTRFRHCCPCDSRVRSERDHRTASGRSDQRLRIDAIDPRPAPVPSSAESAAVVLSTGLAVCGCRPSSPVCAGLRAVVGAARGWEWLSHVHGVSDGAALASLLDLNSAADSERVQAGFLFGGITGPAIGGLVVGFSIRALLRPRDFTLGLAALWLLCFCGLPNRSRRSGSRSRAARRRQLNPDETLELVVGAVSKRRSSTERRTLKIPATAARYRTENIRMSLWEPRCEMAVTGR